MRADIIQLQCQHMEQQFNILRGNNESHQPFPNVDHGG
jgi:hypothetical protein